MCEIIVVNDGSNDKTLEVVESLSYPNLSVINNHKNPSVRGYCAPISSVSLMAKTRETNEEPIDFGIVQGAGKLKLNLSPSGDLIEVDS